MAGLAAGDFNTKIMLLAPSVSKDGFGEQIETFQEVTEVWAIDEPMSIRGMASAREAILGGAETAVGLRYITIRYREDLTTKWRIRFTRGRLKGQELLVKDVRDMGDRVRLVLIVQTLNG